ncbi:N-acetyltransferase family protein [Pseudonocardia sp. CA-107938]|uniref:GNAT family N-acetyltransferase n=1 Tax=Pseudonocardia sp. CA-107938 TaxID=3240021 RepID=UPI003D8A88B0
MITTRQAELFDDDALVVTDDATWSTLTSPAPHPGSPRSFFARTPVEDVIVGELDGRVVGFVVLRNVFGDAPSHQHVLEINGLAVHPDATGHGLGAGLVEAAVAEAEARGARKVTLRVLAHNDRARRLYARCGFTEEGVLREEFLLDGAYVDDVLMARFVG